MTGLGESARIFLAYGESSWWLTYVASGLGLPRTEEWMLLDTCDATDRPD
jgi:hypothetical protein